jgi:hypothetical protein
VLGYSAATWDEEEGEDASQEDAPPSTSTFEAGCDADMLATAAPTAAESVVVSADLPDGDSCVVAQEPASPCDSDRDSDTSSCDEHDDRKGCVPRGSWVDEWGWF